MGKTVAIIPARAGSKGIPGKNTIEICGKPLIAWSILQALHASKIDSVWVSSDGDSILEIATAYGAHPIPRPEEIAGDTASSEAAWLHAIDFIEKQTADKIDHVVGMQATSPLRHVHDLDNALTKYHDEKLDSLLSVVAIEDFFVWEQDQGNVTSVNYDYKDRKPRQLIKKQYRENGSFYIFTPELIRQTNNRLGGKIGMYVMDEYKMFQIDNTADVKLNEVIMKGYQLDAM